MNSFYMNAWTGIFNFCTETINDWICSKHCRRQKIIKTFDSAFSFTIPITFSFWQLKSKHIRNTHELTHRCRSTHHIRRAHKYSRTRSFNIWQRYGPYICICMDLMVYFVACMRVRCAVSLCVMVVSHSSTRQQSNTHIIYCVDTSHTKRNWTLNATHTLNFVVRIGREQED